MARHHLARTAADVVSAVRAVVACHSSDPITLYLAAWARVPKVTIAAVDQALYEERALWRLHAMRRTLFVVPSADAAMFHAAAGADVARSERKRLEVWLADEIGAKKVPRWIRDVEGAVLANLSHGGELRTQELSARIPELAREVTLGAGKWTQRVAVGSRLLFLMAMEGKIARTRPVGTWRGSQYHWVDAAVFAGGRSPFGQLAAADARTELVRRYVATHGPVTVTDIRWWTGFTAKVVNAALAAIDALTVSVEGGGTAFVLADDDAVQRPAKTSVAFLPGLDSTTMGWKERDFYLGDFVKVLFDANGNAGPTVWVDGRIVGGWGQRKDGEVVFRLLVDIGRAAQKKVAAEAAALSAWLDGVVALPRFRTPLEKEISIS